ncbi:unnamed protein product, partial [Symbiodinium pilosum]
IPSQIRRFRIESATCICCDLQHQHPLSGMPLMCDKDQVLHGMAEESFSGAKMLTGFNAMVRERAPTLERLASITVSQPMLELLSTCVLPSLPRYILLWWLGPTEPLAFWDLQVWSTLLAIRWMSLFLMLVFSLLLLLVLSKAGQVLGSRLPPVLLRIALSSTYLVGLALAWIPLRL